MRQLITLAAVLSLVLGLGTPASAAPILIDDFTNPSPFVSIGSSDPLSLLVGSPTLAGTTRTITGSAPLAFGEAGAIGANIPYGGTIGTLPGSLAIFTAPSAIETFLTYSFLPAQDFSGLAGIQLTFRLIDGGVSATNMDVYTIITSSAGVATRLLVLPNSGVGQSVLVPFNTFVGPLDTSSVNSIAFHINDNGTPQTAADFILTSVSIYEIPEPATVAICGVFGIMGLVAGRRKLKSKKGAEATAA